MSTIDEHDLGDTGNRTNFGEVPDGKDIHAQDAHEPVRERRKTPPADDEHPAWAEAEAKIPSEANGSTSIATPIPNDWPGAVEYPCIVLEHSETAGVTVTVLYDKGTVVVYTTPNELFQAMVVLKKLDAVSIYERYDFSVLPDIKDMPLPVVEAMITMFNEIIYHYESRQVEPIYITL